eukprot:gene6831-10477_t
MVACSQSLAGQAGVDILKKGGNAMEAAVCVGACLAVLEAGSTGLGGDGFCLYYDAGEKKVQAINGSGRTPAALTLDVALQVVPEGDTSLPLMHAHTVTVPGVVAMWLDCLEKYSSGKVSRADVFAAAVDFADNGFAVGQVASAEWKAQEPKLKARKHGSEMLLNGNRAPEAGDVMHRKQLARVLESISQEGKSALYEGRVAQAIVDAIKELGGVMELSDLKQHETTFAEPVTAEFAGLTVHGHPPNGQGLTALIALNILTELEKKETGGPRAEWDSPERLHTLVEIIRLAFADAKKYIGDPDHASGGSVNSVNETVKALLAQEYAASRAALVDPGKRSDEVPHGYPLKDSCTVSFQVVDAQGNAVSMVNSTYMGFGTCIVPKDTGFTLQNRGHNFNLEKGHANCLAPRKRPYHTIIPCITTHADGSLHSTFTNMGGFMQPQGHVQHLVNMLHYGLDPQESVDRPRFCVLNDPYSGVFGRVGLEEGFSPETRDGLKALGHDAFYLTGLERTLVGRAQIICKKQGSSVLVAGSDPRADGAALGW